MRAICRWLIVASLGSVLCAYGAGGPNEKMPLESSRSDVMGRAGFAPFMLQSLDGEHTIALEDYRGRIIVVNFWASWCAPCRHEIPLLDRLSEELDAHQAVVIGLNEDYDPSDGLRFIHDIGGVSYPNAAGEGRLIEKYNYAGLPYTVILNREHRVIKTLSGFGDSIDTLRGIVLTEIGN
jgi:thiol-disulfide isomerase/thioredoxin